MALLDNAVDGLFGAVTTGVFGGVAIWWSRRSRRGQLEDAWKQQADELDERLAAQYNARIEWLQQQLTMCQSEQVRLNKLLTRRGRADD